MTGNISKSKGFKGDPGKDFTYDMFTEEQLANLKGPGQMEFKGEIEEALLPTEGNKKGDVYKLKTGETEERVYVFGKIYNWGSPMYNRLSWLGDLLTIEERSLVYDNNLPLTLSIDIYNTDWEYITTISDVYLDEIYGEWTVDSYIYNLPEGLENDVPYCFVRTNPITPWNTNAPKQIFPIDSRMPANMLADYAIYNGETFDKFYGTDKVDDKYEKKFKPYLDVKMSEFEKDVEDEMWDIAFQAANEEIEWSKEEEIYPYVSKKIDEVKTSLQWKTLIDTTLTEEQAGVSSIYIEIPNWEMLKTATRMRLLVDIASGENAIESQTLQMVIRNNGGGMYNSVLLWLSTKCDANKKLMTRAAYEIFPIENEKRYYFGIISPPTMYSDANTAGGNMSRVNSSMSFSHFEKSPPYLHVYLASGGIMATGTRIFLEVYE